MYLRLWTGVMAAALAVIALAAIAVVPSFPAGLAPDATPITASSSPVTPGSSDPPLYTPIPVYEARNVVGRVTIELTDRGFIPSRFENAINQEISFTLINTGSRPHTFTIDELNVDIVVVPGETKTLTIPSPPRLKQYVYYSDTPEDRVLGMQGIMTIFI